MATDLLDCPHCGDEVYAGDACCDACGAPLPCAAPEDLRDPASSQTTPPVGATVTRAAYPDPEKQPLAVRPSPPAPAYLTSPRFDTPIRPLSAPIDEGFGERLRRGWAFMKQCLGMWTKDEDLLVPSILAFFSLTGFYLVCYLVMRRLGLWEGGWPPMPQPVWLQFLAGVPMLLGAHLISYFYSGMTVDLVDRHLKGGDADLADAFRDAARNLGALLALALHSAIAGALRSRAERGGAAVSVATTVLESGWHAATYLILPVVVIEGRPLRQAMRRGDALHRGHFPEYFMVEIGVLLLNRIITIAALVLGIGQGAALYFLVDPSLLGIAITIGLTVVSFAFIFATYLRSACYTCLYEWVAAIEEADRPVPAPAPLAEAIAIA